MLMFYSGANMEYVCYARTPQPAFTWSISAGTMTNIVDAANTATVTIGSAHGLALGNGVTVSGASSDPDLNGTYLVQSIISPTQFTITTANVTDATYAVTSITVSTTAPRSSAPIWAIQKMTYSGDNMIMKQWAGGAPSVKWACDNRAVATGTSKVTYQ
jgi:hypothetical protein